MKLFRDLGGFVNKQIKFEKKAPSQRIREM